MTSELPVPTERRERVPEVAFELASTIAENAPLAIRGTKQILRDAGA